jgi:hypothetical protein
MSSAQQTANENAWLFASINVEGTMETTSDMTQATRFTRTTDGTGRIQTYSDETSYYSAFAPSIDENSGFIRMDPDGFGPPAVTFWLQRDKPFVLYSAGEDGPGLEGPAADDPRTVLTCPSRDQPVYLDNGSFAASEKEPMCLVDTLYYYAVV